MLPFRARVDQGAIAMKGWSAFLKAPASLEHHHPIVHCHMQDTPWVGVLPLCRGAVGVFYSPTDWAYIYTLGMGMIVRVFVNGSGDLASIPGRVIPKTQKLYLMPPCFALSIISYGSRVKWNNPRDGVAPCPTPSCCSYRKVNLRVTLDYGCQRYFLIYIYIYIYM